MKKPKTELQTQIIELLAKGIGRREIAKELGCNVQTVDRVKANPELKEHFYRRCAAEMESLIPAAVKALSDILTNDEAQESVKVAAAREVLNRSQLHEVTAIKSEPIVLKVLYD